MKKLVKVNLSLVMVMGLLMLFLTSCNKNSLKEGDKFELEDMDKLLSKVFDIKIDSKRELSNNDFPLVFVKYKYYKKTKKITISKISNKYKKEELTKNQETLLWMSAFATNKEGYERREFRLKSHKEGVDNYGYIVTCVGGEYDEKVT